MSVAENRAGLLKKAKNWSKAVYRYRDFNKNKHVCLCVLGAMDTYLSGAPMPSFSSLRNSTNDLQREFGIPRGFSIVHFNDGPETNGLSLYQTLKKLFEKFPLT